MKILIVDQFRETGGAQLCLRDLAPEIARRGWQAIFVAPGNGPMGQHLAEFGIASERLPGGDYSNGRKTLSDVARYAWDVPRSTATIGRMVAREGVDLMYVNGPRALPACVAVRCPVVFHLHSHLNKTYAKFIAGACIRISGANAMAVSEFAQSAIRGFVDSRRMRVVYSGVADMGFAPRPFDEDAICIGMVGRIAPEKGQLDFLRAARFLYGNSGKRIEFILFGASMFSDKPYGKQVREQALGLPVNFAGWSDDVANALHQLHILVVPSAAIEAAGRVVMEAMSAGTVVVAYRSGGIPELVCNGRTGVLTEQSTPEFLAREITSLLAEPERAAQIAHAARAEWERRFRIERYQKDVCDFLEEVVSEKESPSNSKSKRTADTLDLTQCQEKLESAPRTAHSESL